MKGHKFRKLTFSAVATAEQQCILGCNLSRRGEGRGEIVFGSLCQRVMFPEEFCQKIFTLQIRVILQKYT